MVIASIPSSMCVDIVCNSWHGTKSNILLYSDIHEIPGSKNHVVESRFSGAKNINILPWPLSGCSCPRRSLLTSFLQRRLSFDMLCHDLHVSEQDHPTDLWSKWDIICKILMPQLLLSSNNIKFHSHL